MEIIIVTNVGAIAYISAFFGRGGGPIALSYLQCVGNEERLVDCVSGVGRTCSHTEDAGVRCQVQTSKCLTLQE